MLGVGDRVTDDILELHVCQPRSWCEDRTHEDLENASGLLVDEARDTLDTTTTSKTANSGLCDTPDERVMSAMHSPHVDGGLPTHWMLSRRTFL
jgi:hypothetical protein